MKALKKMDSMRPYPTPLILKIVHIGSDFSVEVSCGNVVMGCLEAYIQQAFSTYHLHIYRGC